MSAAVGPNPFARTSGLTQPADQTKAVAGFYGNIDFGQETASVDFRKSTGRDLNIRNPYVENKSTYSNFNQLVERIREVCNGTTQGIRELEIFLRTNLDKK